MLTHFEVRETVGEGSQLIMIIPNDENLKKTLKSKLAEITKPISGVLYAVFNPRKLPVPLNYTRLKTKLPERVESDIDFFGGIDDLLKNTEEIQERLLKAMEDRREDIVDTINEHAILYNNEFSVSELSMIIEDIEDASINPHIIHIQCMDIKQAEILKKILDLMTEYESVVTNWVVFDYRNK